MKTVHGVNRISIVLVSLFCCHGLTDRSALKGEEIEKSPNFFVVSVVEELIPMHYPIPFFDPSIKMLDVPNKLLDHKFTNDKNAAVTTPLILYETLTQIPDPNASKRIIRQANTTDGLLTKANLTKSPHDVYNNTMNSTAEHSTGMIDTMLNGASHCTYYIMTIKNQSMKIIDSMWNGVSKRASYSIIKQRTIDLIPTVSACTMIGAFVGILLFVAVRANHLRNAQREVHELPENIRICMV